MQTLKGYCPMGCGQTLFVDDGGHITCSWVECPRPNAIDILLDDPDIVDHTVVVTKIDNPSVSYDVSMQHPIHERIDGDLFNCDLSKHLATEGVPEPIEDGTYSVSPRYSLWGDSWDWRRTEG